MQVVLDKQVPMVLLDQILYLVQFKQLVVAEVHGTMSRQIKLLLVVAQLVVEVGAQIIIVIQWVLVMLVDMILLKDMMVV